MNANGLGVDGIPVNVNNLDVNGNQTDWTLSHNDFPHYQISLLGYLGPFSNAHLLLPTPNLSLVCVTTQVPYLSPHIARAWKHRTLSNEFDTTLLQGRTAFPLVHDSYLHTSCVFVLAKWIPEKTPPNHFQRNFLNVFQTSSWAWVSIELWLRRRSPQMAPIMGTQKKIILFKTSLCFQRQNG